MPERTPFVVVLKPPRLGFAENASPEEQELVSRHFAYLKSKLFSGELVMAGGTEAAEFGLGIFNADSLGAAQHFVWSDPAVQGGVFAAEVYPFRIALLQVRN